MELAFQERETEKMNKQAKTTESIRQCQDFKTGCHPRR
jgi:hypothetical protein